MPFVKLKDKQPARYADTVFYYPRYDTCNRHRFLGADGMPEDTEWLDESVTEDMVKDLVFQIEGYWASCAAVTGNYEVAFFGCEQSFEYAVGDGSGWKKCDSQAHGIALCNAHHKKIILSQLK